jgi:hypothetical protein
MLGMETFKQSLRLRISREGFVAHLLKFFVKKSTHEICSGSDDRKTKFQTTKRRKKIRERKKEGRVCDQVRSPGRPPRQGGLAIAPVAVVARVETFFNFASLV